MRIVIAGPPKSGNVWLKCLLASTYGIRVLGPGAVPPRPELPLLLEWLNGNGFPDGSIFHQHFDYSHELADQFAAVPAHLITIVRDPYDAFVSSYYALQTRVDTGQRGGRKIDLLFGKPLDSPEVYHYLRAGGSRRNLVVARDWIQSGRSHVVRYEQLHADPAAALKRLTDDILPVPETRLGLAIDAWSADNMRKMGGDLARHVRTATVGESREKLTGHHLAIFRELHAGLIQEMGYQVR
ncbi:MAG: sulfotransferase [Chloroflexota bacterium]|nr:sulfotransferase [Chloroflexota bacterium]